MDERTDWLAASQVGERTTANTCEKILHTRLKALKERQALLDNNVRRPTSNNNNNDDDYNDDDDERVWAGPGQSSPPPPEQIPVAN